MNVSIRKVLRMFFRKPQIIVPQPVVQICQRLNTNGYQAYIVGGAIRDCYMYKTPTDWDLTTDATPDIVQKLFTNTITTGERYGTITVKFKKLLCEVTTMRLDAEYTDGRRPDSVRFSTDLVQDLQRRDFTVNAIAYDPLSQDYIDPFQGRKDIKLRTLRAVGDAKQRFKEDALRMLRLVRFSATLGFRPDRKAIAAINPEQIINVAQERIQDELSKLLVAPQVTKALELLHRSGLLAKIIPELDQAAHVTQGSRHHLDVLGHSFLATNYIKPELPLRLAALLHDISKPVTKQVDNNGYHFHNHDQLGANMAEVILNRLKYSKQIQRKVSQLIKHHMFQVHPHSTDKALRRFIVDVGLENVYDLIELRKADAMAMRHQPRQVWNWYQQMNQRMDEVIASMSAFSLRDLQISGTDIIVNFNLKPGPQIGIILEHLLQFVLDNPEHNTYEALLEQAKLHFEQHQLIKPEGV